MLYFCMRMAAVPPCLALADTVQPTAALGIAGLAATRHEHGQSGAIILRIHCSIQLPFSSYFPDSFQLKQPRALSTAAPEHCCASHWLQLHPAEPCWDRTIKSKAFRLSLVVPMSTQLSEAQTCAYQRRNYVEMDFFLKKKVKIHLLLASL